jgi:alpha-glucuronidase
MKRLVYLFLLLSLSAHADDGYKLWLKYETITDKTVRSHYLSKLQTYSAEQKDPSIEAAIKELKIALPDLLGIQPKAAKGTGLILKVNPDLAGSNAEGFLIKTNAKSIEIQGKTSMGVLYGVFHLLRSMQTGISPDGLHQPQIQHRMLNHWDNNNGTIERGYAGMSLWKWYELPERIDPRYIDYARANASIGINATVINNVNASARFLSSEYLGKVKALADAFRPYGIKVYLSVNFASPKLLGKLPDADPLKPEVQAWWKDKADEIYGLIPDFGGFLVKANSEGEPGPMDYGRTHVDGANMLAKAVQPHGGLVFWRAFVYAADPKGDRFKAAYQEFKHFDGQFDDNVIVQVKNGPIDFMPREPISPLFTAMEKTPLAMEFQITQEYLGWATHWVYLGTMFEEALQTDTRVGNKKTTLSSILKGETFGYRHTAITGVANTGSDRNWTGHPMAQANWYALGRLAWNPDLKAEEIAKEWIPQTLTRNPATMGKVRQMMLKTRDIYINYTSPFGLHHVMGEGHHFGPEPWVEKAPRPDWTALYYHRASEKTLGFNRTATGSQALSQFPSQYAAQFEDPEKCPEDFLLWYHAVPWDRKMKSGKTFWTEFVLRFYRGAEEVKELQQEWKSLETMLPQEVYQNVSARLQTQYKEAIWWRDACVLYFQTFSKLPLPSEVKAPERSLEDVKKIVDVYHIR